VSDEWQRVLGFSRRVAENEVLVVLNFSGEERRVALPEKVSGPFVNVFSGENHDFSTGRELTLQPWSFSVLEN
jgi:hypothetical protein